MNRKNDGILSRDVYAQARRHLKGMDKATRPLWQNQGFCLFVTMLLAVMDGINLFSVYDTILYESQAMLWAMTATTAFCPCYWPSCSDRWRERTERNDKSILYLFGQSVLAFSWYS